MNRLALIAASAARLVKRGYQRRISQPRYSSRQNDEMQRVHDVGKCIRCRQKNDRHPKWICLACARLEAESRKARRTTTKVQCCRRCTKPGHNARTCLVPP